MGLFHSRHRPRLGDRYTVKTAFTAIIATYWYAPCTGGGEVLLPAGLDFVVEETPMPEATGVSATPEPSARWAEVLVSAETRADEKFAGYAVKIGFDQLARHCKRI